MNDTPYGWPDERPVGIPPQFRNGIPPDYVLPVKLTVPKADADARAQRAFWLGFVIALAAAFLTYGALRGWLI